MICKTFPIGEGKNYKYVVVLSNYQDKILLSRHKDRNTWETQGGHIEIGETPMQAARRELYEESGALEFTIESFCDYWAGDFKTNAGEYGVVYIASIKTLGEMPISEMAEVKLFDTLPENLTYPPITTTLFQKLEDKIEQEKKSI